MKSQNVDISPQKRRGKCWHLTKMLTSHFFGGKICWHLTFFLKCWHLMFLAGKPVLAGKMLTSLFCCLFSSHTLFKFDTPYPTSACFRRISDLNGVRMKIFSFFSISPYDRYLQIMRKLFHPFWLRMPLKHHTMMCLYDVLWCVWYSYDVL